jgi:hypothetical protein
MANLRTCRPAGGRTVLAPAASGVGRALFAFVHGCEAKWELDDRLRVFARARRNDRDQGQT